MSAYILDNRTPVVGRTLSSNMPRMHAWSLARFRTIESNFNATNSRVTNFAAQYGANLQQIWNSNHVCMFSECTVVAEAQAPMQILPHER